MGQRRYRRDCGTRPGVEPFVLTLLGTARGLKSTELNDLLELLENTVYEYAIAQAEPPRRDLQLSDLKFIKFNDVTQEYERALQSMISQWVWTSFPTRFA